MTRWIATAPGKLHIAGEYAVLDGAPAVMFAVDRRATAAAGARRGDATFLDAVLAVIVARHGDGRAAARAREVAVDTAALCDAGVKLGLGSSAAATVAATAYALAAEDGTIDRDEVHAIARVAHAAAQGRRGARGSGADIAAAMTGGVIAVTPHLDRPIVDRLALPALVIIPFWTGLAADTATLVAAVTAAASRPAVRAAIAALGQASEALIAAAAPAAAIAAIAAGGDALGQLAAATGLALEPPIVATARRIAAAAGGAAKTTGAGGGDVAIVVLPPDADEAGVRAALAAAGVEPLAIRIDPRGVDIEAADV